MIKIFFIKYITIIRLLLTLFNEFEFRERKQRLQVEKLITSLIKAKQLD